MKAFRGIKKNQSKYQRTGRIKGLKRCSHQGQKRRKVLGGQEGRSESEESIQKLRLQHEK